MYERAELIGANLEIHSDPDQGTQLVIALPSSNEDDESDGLPNGEDTVFS
jgi:nitrate/nitrite-specific signal transduction histidine kinase